MVKNFKRLFAICLSLIILIGILSVTASAAVSYKGKGSKSNPYIVETVEQLEGMRNNLKAHYKLGNTIDLSTVANFKPIGTLDAPFKGTFVCDLDESGKPKFAIKNLKIEIAPAGCTKAEGFSGYKENKSGWEAGLFGYASGATFKNILVLDATVVSKVEGCYQMNGDYTVNPGTDEQAAGILLALGKKVTVTGCGVSGSVTSSSNHTGGMIGNIDSSKVSKCYSYATVTSTGAWSSGGLVATISKSTVSTSFYSGTFSGGQTHAGAFAGDVYDEDSKVTDCWAEGTVKTEDSGCFLGTKNHTDGTDLESVDMASNCYTLAKIEGRKNAQTNKKVKNNNYITNEIGGFEMGYAAASQQEMNEAFKSLSNWVVKDGTYPQLKGIVPTKDAAAYVVNEVTNDAPAEDTSSESETQTDGEKSEEEEKEADLQVKTVFDNTLTSLRGTELVLVIALGALVFITMVAAVVVFIVAIKKFGVGANAAQDELSAETENEE